MYTHILRRKILLTGAVQSLFEGAMYIFVLQVCNLTLCMCAYMFDHHFVHILDCYVHVACVRAHTYIACFVQWPPAFKALVDKQHSVPFGTIFACLMTSCMLGSSLFGLLLRANVEV